MASSTSSHSHSFTYPDEGATGWNATMVTFFQDLSDDLDSIGVTELTLIDDANGNEMLAFSVATGAVNHLQVTNAATGASPSLAAVGDDTNINLVLTPKGGGTVDIDGVSWPAADGTADQVLKTDGAGTAAWTDVSAVFNVVEDTTPQLGGQLDVNGNAIGDGTRELVTFTEDASAINNVNIANAATGASPVLSVVGDDADIGLTLQVKGSGVFTLLDGNGNEILVTETVAGAQNYLHLANSTSAVELAARGDDTNIDITLDPKGSGEVSCNGNLAVSAFVGANSTEKLTVSSTDINDVNYIDILATNTAVAPILSAQGDDAAVGLDIATKSSGALTLKTDDTSRLDITNSGIRLGAANARVTTILDEDNLASDSATSLVTQQSVKAYVDGLTFSLLDEDNMASNSSGAAASQQSIKAYVDGLTFSLLDEDNMASNSSGAAASQQSIKAYVDGLTFSLLDEDNMASDSATAAASQQSIKAYVDAQVGSVGSWTAVSETAVANDAQVDIAITGGYDEYMVVLTDVYPATDNADIQLRISDDSASTYETTGYDYVDFFVNNTYDDNAAETGGYHSTSTSRIIFAKDVGNADTEGLCGHIRLINGVRLDWDCSWIDGSGNTWFGKGAGHRSTTAYTHLRFYADSGNLTAGTIVLLGRNHS